MTDITEPIPYGLGGESVLSSPPVDSLFSHGSIAKMWFGGYALSGYLTGVSMEYSAGKIESTPFGNDNTTYMPGIDECSMSLDGYYDTNTANPSTTLEKYLYDNRRETMPVVYFPGYSTDTGSPAFFMNGWTNSYSVETTVDDAASFEVDLLVSAPLSHGIVLKPDGAQVTSGSSNSYDSGATRRGLKAMLSVSAVGGVTPTLSVTVQHSPDNSTWSDLVSFNSTGEMSAEYVADASLLAQRYLRASWTMTGTSPSFTFNVSVSQSGNFA